GPWGPWELTVFLLTRVLPIVLAIAFLYSVAGGIVYYRAEIYPQKSFIELMQLSFKRPPFFRVRAAEPESDE
ncbi:MAG: hypothetical protein ABSC76_17610, partial [Terracidiphilus sp.]